MLLKMNSPRTLSRLALGALALFGVLGMLHPSSSFGEGLVDGMRGALLGATIALVYLTSRKVS
jgi:hypothetical protein